MPEVQPAMLIAAHVVEVEFEPRYRAVLHGRTGVSVSVCGDAITITLIHGNGTMLCALLSEEQLDVIAHQLRGHVDPRRPRLQ